MRVQIPEVEGEKRELGNGALDRSRGGPQVKTGERRAGEELEDRLEGVFAPLAGNTAANATERAAA